MIIIGAGISGITTGLVLQLLGFDTTIYAAQTYNEVQADSADPYFASRYPAASVIPHSVNSPEMKELFMNSQSTFYELRKLTFSGLTIHKHYECFEFEQSPPDYLSWMLDSRLLEKGSQSTSIPKRSSAKQIHGWVFNCIFADWALYFPALIQLYRETGGKITVQELKQKDIPELPSNTVINCSGFGSRHLFEDPAPHYLLRGHLLHKPNAPVLTNKQDEIVSYNYTPLPSVYADPQGDPCDVYFYPRKDGWVVGGSRQLGTLSEDGSWSGDRQQGALYEKENTSYPAPIFEINKEIIETLFDRSFGSTDEFFPKVGYRYIRKKEDGLRLEPEEVYGKKIYHNYGHGGAGVTLSWGCAFDIAAKISEKPVDAVRVETVNGISEVYQP